MKFSKDNLKPWMKNKYFIISLSFALWLCFFDQNNLFFHHDLSVQQEELEIKKGHYTKEIEHSKEFLSKLNDSTYIERYARENYRMKKDNEDVFVVIEK